MSKQEATTKPRRLGAFVQEVVVATQGVGRLAFLSANGIGAYVLWFSSDSLTLKVVAGVLAVQAAVQALAMSTKR